MRHTLIPFHFPSPRPIYSIARWHPSHDYQYPSLSRYLNSSLLYVTMCFFRCEATINWIRSKLSDISNTTFTQLTFTSLNI